MRTRPLEPSVELPMGHQTCEGCAKVRRGPHANAATGAFGEAPHGAKNRVRAVPKWVAGTHATAATGAFGGAPYGATNRMRGAQKWVSMRGGGACGHGHLGLRWSSLCGHERCAAWYSLIGCRECTMRTLPLGPSVEFLLGTRSV